MAEAVLAGHLRESRTAALAEDAFRHRPGAADGGGRRGGALRGRSGRLRRIPRHNLALARAARAAREAGLSDGLIADAIARARFGDLDEPHTEPPQARRARLALICDPAEFDEETPAAARAAQIAWETGDLVVAFGARDAALVSAVETAPRLVLDINRFVQGGRLDMDGLAAAVRLWVIALEIELAARLVAADDGRSLAITLAGLSEWLVRQGLSYDSQEARRAAADVFALVAAAGLVLPSTGSACSPGRRHGPKGEVRGVQRP